MRGQSIHSMPRTSVGAPSIWLVIFCFGVALDSEGNVPNQITAKGGGRARRQSLFFYLLRLSRRSGFAYKSSQSVSIFNFYPQHLLLVLVLVLLRPRLWFPDSKAGLNSNMSTIRFFKLKPHVTQVTGDLRETIQRPGMETNERSERLTK